MGVGTFMRFAVINLEIPLVHTLPYVVWILYALYFGSRFVKAGKKLRLRLVSFIAENVMPWLFLQEKLRIFYILMVWIRQWILFQLDWNWINFIVGNYSEEDLRFMRESFGIDESEFLCVYIGRIAEEKSIDLLIDMFSKIKDEKI